MPPSRSHKSCLSFCQINLCGLKLSRYRFSSLMSPDGHFKGLIGDTRGLFGSPLVRLKTSILVHLQKQLNEKRSHPMWHLWGKTCQWQSRHKSWGSSKTNTALRTCRANKDEQNGQSVWSTPPLILIHLHNRRTKADAACLFVNRLWDQTNKDLTYLCQLLICVLCHPCLQMFHSTTQLSLKVKMI